VPQFSVDIFFFFIVASVHLDVTDDISVIHFVIFKFFEVIVIFQELVNFFLLFLVIYDCLGHFSFG